MKKFLMAALLFCGTLTGFAQSQGDFRFGVTGGMNVSNITDSEGDCRIGFNVGAKIDYAITNSFYVTSGLTFTQKGSKWGEENFELKANPLYLNIPIYAGYRYHLDNNMSLFGEVGPYFAFGIAGKLKAKEEGLEEKVDYFDEAENFDAGIGLRAGLEVNHFQVHFGYEYGFCEVLDASSSHNSNFNIGVSYMF